MEKKHLIWVATVSGVVGFEPYEIAEFEREFEKLKPYIAIEDKDDAKWNFFNEYFEDALRFRTATHYSALWYDGEAWDELERSIVASLAKDVTIGIKNNLVDMTITAR